MKQKQVAGERSGSWFQLVFGSLLPWLCLSSGVALYWPWWVPAGAFDPFVASKPILPWLIGLTMLAIGLMLPRDEVSQVVRRWPSVLGGTAIQYITMPALAYLAATSCGLSGDLLIGVVLVGSVPGAMASNVLTLNAGGNTSYSVSLTTAATLVSPLAVPLVLGWLLGGQQRVDDAILLRSSGMLLLTVVLPVVAGHLVARSFPGWERWTTRLGPWVANVAILWIIAAVVGRNREPLSQFQVSLIAILLTVNIGGYLAGYGGAWLMRLPVGMRRALTLEVGMQNAGLGAALATALFPDHPTISLAPALYTFGCMLTGTVLAAAFRASTRPRPSGR